MLPSIEYRGDAVEASKYRVWALQRWEHMRTMALLLRHGKRYNRVEDVVRSTTDAVTGHRWWDVAPGVRVEILLSWPHDRITITAETDDLFYEFFTTDECRLYANGGIKSPAYADEEFPNIFVDGHDMLYGVGRRIGRYVNAVVALDGIPDADGNWSRFVTEETFLQVQKRQGAQWHGKPRGKLVFSNISEFRYRRRVPARVMKDTPGTGIGGTFFLRDIGFNIPPTAFHVDGIRREPRISAPNSDVEFVDKLAADTNDEGWHNPTTPWHQTAAVGAFGDPGSKAELFVYTDIHGALLKMFPCADTYYAEPTVIGSETIPLPSWATLPEPGIGSVNSGLQWHFSRDGKRMCTVLHKLVEQDFPFYYDGVGSHNVSGPLAYDYEMAIPIRLGPNPGNWNQRFGNPYDFDVRSYRFVPGVVEYAIEAAVAKDAEGNITTITPQLTLIRELFSEATNRYYSMADFSYATDQLVTLELETWLLDGEFVNTDNVFAVGGPHAPPFGDLGDGGASLPDDPYRMQAFVSMDAVMYQYPAADSDDPPVEKVRIPAWYGPATYGLNKSIVGSAANPGLLRGSEFFNTGHSPFSNTSYQFVGGQFDLRAYAYWGLQQRTDFVTPNNMLRKQLLWGYHGKQESKPYLAPGLDYPFTVPARDDNFQAASPLMTFVQAYDFGLLHNVGQDNNGYFWHTEFSTAPMRNAVALCTPVITERVGVGVNIYESAAYIDFIDVHGHPLTSHEALYHQVRDRLLEAGEPAPPDYDWEFYGYHEPFLSTFTPFRTNIGSFRSGGAFFRAPVDLYNRVFRRAPTQEP